VFRAFPPSFEIHRAVQGQPDPSSLHALRDLEESERVRAFGAIVAHDLNNALFVLSGRMQLLRRQATDPTLAASLDSLRDTVKLFESQLALLHHASPRDQFPDSFRSIRSVLLAFFTAPETATFEISGSEELLEHLPADASIEGDGDPLRVALRQLLALHRMRGARTLHISAAIESANQATLTISIEDHAGCAATHCNPPSLLGGSFDLAHLPIAAAARAVRDFGGSVRCNNTANGVCSECVVPIRRGMRLNPEQTDSCEHASIAAPPARRILVADDDPAVRALLIAALESVGDDLDSTDSPASVATRTDLANFDAMVLDAGGGGIEALYALRDRGETLPVLLVSGAPVDELPSGTTRMLLKPFPLDELDRTLTKLCAARG